MGKHSWTRHEGEELHDKQPSCMWGIIHILDYHFWRSNVRKIINHRQYESAAPLSCDWSPRTKYDSPDVHEVEELLDVKETDSRLNTKRSHSSKKRSLRGRIKSLIAEDFYKENHNSENKQGSIGLRSSLQRTYSMHHLESLDTEIDKICSDWKQSVVFVPESVEHKDESILKEHEYNETIDDILDIFKVDKDLFMEQLQDSDKGVADFSLGLNVKARLSKSRSFPVVELSERIKLKPSKLENKLREIWSFAKEEKSQVSNSSRLDLFGTTKTTGEKSAERYILKRSHGRSLSLNESLERYIKLHASKSLKIENENGHGPMSFRRIRSLSNGGYYSSDLNFTVVGDDLTVNDLKLTAKDDRKEDIESENMENVEEKVEILKISDSCKEEETCKNVGELQFSQASENSSHSDELSASMKSNNKTWLFNEGDAKKEHNSDLYYVRHLLEQSGIATASDDQPLGPRIFEKAEASWPHDREELNGWPDFDGCWHHMMLFHLVNEMLLEIYDISLPYYPKPLSHSCHVRPFPFGNRIIEEVSAKVGKLSVNMELVETESFDYVVGRDLENDRSWMNLQFESECMGLEIVDAIFDEILEEIVSSC